jgi:hypothetical protein
LEGGIEDGKQEIRPVYLSYADDRAVHRISDVPACCEVTNELSFYFRCSMALRDIEGDMRNGGSVPLFCMQVLL